MTSRVLAAFAVPQNTRRAVAIEDPVHNTGIDQTAAPAEPTNSRRAPGTTRLATTMDPIIVTGAVPAS